MTKKGKCSTCIGTCWNLAKQRQERVFFWNGIKIYRAIWCAFKREIEKNSNPPSPVVESRG